MTCSENFGRLIRACCMGLIGTLAIVGCGGSQNAKPADADVGASGEVGPGLGTPSLKVSPASVNFGSIDVGSTSTTPSLVTLTNTGAVTTVSPTVTGSSGFAIESTTCGPPLPTNGTCAISLKFAPASVGLFSGVLNISPGLSVSLTGMGNAPGSFSVTDRVDLGVLLVNASAPVIVLVTPTPSVTGLTCVAAGVDLTPDPLNTTCSATGAISKACNHAFIFKTTTAGTKSNSVTCSASGTSKTIPVTATVATPASLVITPNPASFAATVGTPSAAVTLNVSNIAGSITGSLTATLGGTDAADFKILTNDCSVPLVALGICKIAVVFNPAGAGAKTATLIVTDSTVGSIPAATVLNGIGTPPSLVTIAGTVDLGITQVGIPAPAAAYTVTNGGGTATPPLALGVGGTEFAIGNDLCTGLPLGIGKSCTFTVAFIPTSVGAKSVVLTASANGSLLAALQIQGTGIPVPTPAALTLSPPTLDFGTTGVGVPVGPKTFTVTNTGGTATAALSVVKSDSTSSVGGASQFSFTTTCQALLAPLATCQVVVTYVPTIAGSASAVITVNDGAVKSSNGTTIGIALGIPLLTVACTEGISGSTGSFEGTVVGQTSESEVCTVTNTVPVQGNTPQESGAITPAITGDFSISTNNCTTSLAPNLSCTLILNFKPTGRGQRSGMLTVTSTNRGAANQVLAGTGLLVVEIREYTNATIGGSSLTAVNHDFGQVAVGSESPPSTLLTLAVYVRGQVGNLAITGTSFQRLPPADATAPADFTQRDLAVSGMGPCAAITNTVTPDKANPVCTVVVAFTPKSKGAKTATITATGGDGTTDSGTVKGTGTGPLTVNPTTLTFSSVPVGSASQTDLSLHVCNNASSNATGVAFTITGPNASAFVVTADPLSNQTLAPAASPSSPTCKDLMLRLTIPATDTPGARAATLTVTATIAGVTETANASLVGTAGKPAAIAATLGGAFADTAVTAISAPVVVTVTNAGASATDLLVFDIPASGADFLLSNPPSGQGTCGLFQAAAGNNCPAGTDNRQVWCGAKLDPNASCTIKVWFKPSASLGIVKRTAALTVGSAFGGLQVLSLNANATSQIALAPSIPVDVGLSAFNDQVAPVKTITISNHGGEAIPASNLNIAFANGVGQTGAAEFRVKTNRCTPEGLGAKGSTVPPDSCTVDVQLFAPSNALPGPRSATMAVTNTLNNTQKATLVVSGTAGTLSNLQFVIDPTLTSSASTVDRDFGLVLLGSTSSTQKFTVTNVGAFPSSALSISLFDLDANGARTTTKHAKAADFDTTGTTCTGAGATVQPGASCDIVLAFHPTECSPTDTTCGGTTGALTNGAVKVQLVVTATSGTPTSGLVGAKIFGLATAADHSSDVYITAAGTGGKGTFDFGAGPAVPATSKTALLAVHNDTSTAFTLPALDAFTVTDVTQTGFGSTAAAAIIPSLIPNSTANEFTVSAAPDGTPKACPATGISLTGDFCVFQVTWTPSAATRTGTREVKVSATATRTASTTVLGRVLTPAALLAIPAPIATSGAANAINFGNTVVGVDSVTKSLTIRNVGESATTSDLDVIAGSDEAAGQVVAVSGCKGVGSALAAGATCTLVTAVNPTVATSQIAAGIGLLKVVLAGQTTGLMTSEIFMTWTGVNAARIVPSSTSVKFDDATATVPGTAVLSNGATKQITLTNPANSAPTGALGFRTDANDFTIDLNPANSSCFATTSGRAFNGLAPTTIATDACTLTLIFRPTALATPAKTGNLMVTSTSGATVTVPLSGTALPSLSIAAHAKATNNEDPLVETTSLADWCTWTNATATAAASCAYPAGSVAATAFASETATFSLSAGAPATGSLAVALGGAAAATPDQFKIVSDSCIGTSLSGTDSSASCKVTVRFAPRTTGNKSAVLTVWDPSSGTPVNGISLSLTGAGNP